MTETQIQNGLASLDPQHEFIQALTALVSADIESEAQAVTTPDLTDAARHFNAGRLAHARDIKSVITGAIADAHVARAAAAAAASK